MSSFSEWHVLMDESRPRCEIFQEYLRVVCHVVLIVKSDLISFEFIFYFVLICTALFSVIITLFSPITGHYFDP